MPTPPPRPTPPPQPTPSPFERLDQAARGLEHTAYSETLDALRQQQAHWDAERAARHDAMAAMQESRAAEEQRTGEFHKAHLARLAESFAPQRANAVTVQSLAFNPRYHDLPVSELWDMGRREEGIRNATEFSRALEKMSPEERATLAPMAAGLIKEDMNGALKIGEQNGIQVPLAK